jgi:beta-glucanase (GH16 family)
LDIFEWQSHQPTQFVGSVHVWRNGSDIGNNNGSNQWTLPGGTDLSQYHTYGVLWTPTSLSWYFDDVLVSSWNITVAPFNTVFTGQQSYFLILGQQYGCNWQQTCPGQQSPFDMQVDYVRVYQSPAN